jgi:hypothetical protein
VFSLQLLCSVSVAFFCIKMVPGIHYFFHSHTLLSWVAFVPVLILPAPGISRSTPLCALFLLLHTSLSHPEFTKIVYLFMPTSALHDCANETSQALECCAARHVHFLVQSGNFCLLRPSRSFNILCFYCESNR